MPTFSTYKIVIRLKSHVLSKEDYRQTCNQILLLELKALGTLDRLAHHLSYQGDPKSQPHIFFVLANLDCFDLRTSLSEKVMFKPKQ